VPPKVTVEKQFRQSALRKNQNPEVWVTKPEDLRMQFGEIGYIISGNQFMICILHYLTLDYELKLTLMLRFIGDKDEPATVDEIIDKLNFRFERLDMTTRIQILKL
jgi:hypothetical protein